MSSSLRVLLDGAGWEDLERCRQWNALQEEELQEGWWTWELLGIEGKGNGAARKGESEAARPINRLASLPSETSLNVTEGRDLRV